MRTLTLIALAVVSGASFAQSYKGTKMDFVPRVQLVFTEKPGVREFTGRMIARPLQRAAWNRMGLNNVAADFKHMDAVAKLADLEIGYIGPIDCYIIRVPSGMNENSLSRELMRTGLYEYVEPDYRVFTAFAPNDPQLGTQWSQTNNNATDAWDICRGNAALIVGITDTGVHVSHEDLAANRASGANSSYATTLDTVRTEAVYGTSIVMPTGGHGTHCTGIAAAIGNNGKGICGVNIDGTRHLMVRISEDGYSSNYTAITIGALWAAANGCRVVSTSFSGVQASVIATTGTAMKTQYNAVWCYAAGNDGGTYGSAYDWPDVTIVGATQANNTIASFSARGQFIDVMAPGAGINSTWWTNNGITDSYTYLDGTSMATPYAAGVATMILAENPNYSAQRVEDILYKSCISMGSPGTYGWGRVNLWNAMGRKADTLSVFRGVLVSGGVTDLHRAEGNNLVVAKGPVANAGEAPIQVVTEHALPTTYNGFGEISVEVQARVSTAGTFARKVQLYNFSTNQYDDVASGPIGQTSSFFEATQTSNLANYMSNGICRVRTLVYPQGPVATSNWQASFDQINIRALRATE